MSNKKIVTGIILLAGNSTRYGGLNKNLELLNKQYVFLYSLNAFDKNYQIDNIILVVRSQDFDLVNNIISKLKFNKPIKLVIGGKTRQESVYHALLETSSDVVIIQDAARPMIKQEYINNLLMELNNYDGVIIGTKVKDTIKITNEVGEIISSTNRLNTWSGATPQAFKFNILLKLHEKYKTKSNITDDSMLLELDNYKVKIIEGNYDNIKITTTHDMNYLKTLIKNIKTN